jgi:cytochrome P450
VARIAWRTVLDADLEEHAGASLGVPAREARGVEYVVPLLQGESETVPITRPRAARRMPWTVARIEERLASAEARDDMLGSLLQEARRAGCPLSAPDAIGEAMQLLFAGHLNTPRALEALWSGLADHPDVEQKVLAEVDEVLAGRAPEPGDLARMPYGEMVIKEAMRANTPSGPSLQREALEWVEIGGYSIEPGTLVWVDVHLVHHDPRYFEQPERFWPERFGKDRIHRIPKQAFLPFGAGPRTCIGSTFSMMQMQLILTVVAQSYRLSWIEASADRSRLRPTPR